MNRIKKLKDLQKIINRELFPMEFYKYNWKVYKSVTNLLDNFEIIKLLSIVFIIGYNTYSYINLGINGVNLGIYIVSLISALFLFLDVTMEFKYDRLSEFILMPFNIKEVLMVKMKVLIEYNLIYMLVISIPTIVYILNTQVLAVLEKILVISISLLMPVAVMNIVLGIWLFTIISRTVVKTKYKTNKQKFILVSFLFTLVDLSASLFTFKTFISTGKLIYILIQIFFLAITLVLSIFFMDKFFYELMLVRTSRTYLKRKINFLNKRNKVLTLIKKEFRCFFTVSAYVINSFIGIAIFIEEFIVSYYRGRGFLGINLYGIIENFNVNSIEGIIQIGISLDFLIISTLVFGIPYSREGKNLDGYKLFPLNLKQDFIAKISVGVFIGEIFTVVALALFMATLNIESIYIIMLFIFMKISIILIASIGYKMDKKNPNVLWKSEAQCIRGSRINYIILSAMFALGVIFILLLK